MLSSFFDQFNVVRLITIVPFGGDWCFVFSNLSLMVGGVIFLVWCLFKGDKLVVNRWQIIMEYIYGIIRSLIYENLGNRGQKYFVFVLCLFIFIVIVNILGLFPYVFTPTAHIAVTFSISLSIMVAVTLLGSLNFKIEFLSILVPMGVPLVLAPFLVIIETLSYMIRAISLGVRLAANISAGHLLFGIISGFAFNLLFKRFYVLGVFLVLILGFITLLEMMVAVIQGYVFSLLTTIYFGDTIVLH